MTLVYKNIFLKKVKIKKQEYNFFKNLKKLR
jgi:hypothetical protein